MRAFVITLAAIAAMALVNSAPLKSSSHGDRISPDWKRLFSFPRMSRLFGKTVVRDDGDDKDLQWVTTLPPVDEVWENEMTGDDDSFWGVDTSPTDQRYDSVDSINEEDIPVSTLIPLHGNEDASTSSIWKHLPTIAPQPSYVFSSPASSTTPSPRPLLRPSPSSSAAPSKAPSMSATPAPSSTPLMKIPSAPSPSPSSSASPSARATITNGQSTPERDYVVISGAIVDKSTVTVFRPS